MAYIPALSRPSAFGHTISRSDEQCIEEKEMNANSPIGTNGMRQKHSSGHHRRDVQSTRQVFALIKQQMSVAEPFWNNLPSFLEP
jgi:hypothetical protein